MKDIIDWKNGEITIISYKDNGDIQDLKTMKKIKNEKNLLLKIKDLS